ncbi:P-loop containing nucleoside triphosphate hydrolase protein [Mycena rosella]|uniref:P-loop containing nucleoside triphosphate hydrolase protein n=1 Tax=Mycena rosella TaxID=1033263 RepID=A0AAD7GLR4_MYCRO|nr:P-loop containing nucleoside triphosphate hydrolase protein [Mycena rosella]
MACPPSTVHELSYVQIRESFSKLSNSSSTLSVLPASPKIFHGREAELQDIVATLLANPARATILGTGGMGKTTLAVAALHHPDVMDKYTQCYFVSCESARSCGDLVAIIGSHVGLEPSSQLSKTILRHFSEGAPTLLILDNFETPWEPAASRAEVEEFLSLLTDVLQLGLLVTMRGAERPGKVRWTRPFLPPLNPLPSSASRQTFLEIADNPLVSEESDLSQLIDLTGNLPLAISLMANVASLEGYVTALSRWKAESTALLSDGYDKRSNLDKSIIMSLTSPRMATSPDAQDLLSLLSLLPDGISDDDLFASSKSIPAAAKSTLLRTSLVFIDHDKRLKVLSPIREYIGSVHPPAQTLVRPLRKHLRDLLMLWDRHRQLSSGDLVARLISNLGNMHNVFSHGLSDLPEELAEIGRNILTLESFSRSLGRGSTPLLDRVPELIELTGDSELRWLYFVACLDSPGRLTKVSDVDPLLPQAIEYFVAKHDLSGQGMLFSHLLAYIVLIAQSHPLQQTGFPLRKYRGIRKVKRIQHACIDGCDRGRRRSTATCGSQCQAVSGTLGWELRSKPQLRAREPAGRTARGESTGRVDRAGRRGQNHVLSRPAAPGSRFVREITRVVGDQRAGGLCESNRDLRRRGGDPFPEERVRRGAELQ